MTTASPSIYVLGLITARGGSKGVPKKNIRNFAGHPLLAYTIAQAQQAKLLNRLVVSTDDPEIAAVAREYGAEVPFMRPAELARDDTPKPPVVRHAVDMVEQQGGIKVDIVVDLDVTTPFRSVEDIDNCIQLLLDNWQDTDTVTTVYRAHHNPYFNMVELNGGFMATCKKPDRQYGTRQEAPHIYQMTAAVYAVKVEALRGKGQMFTDRTRPYVMPEERSLMIDTPQEFMFGELMLKNKIVVIPTPQTQQSKTQKVNVMNTPLNTMNKPSISIPLAPYETEALLPKEHVLEELFSLTGKVIILTGGAGIIGTHYARHLAAAGAHVVVVDMNEERCRQLADELTKNYQKCLAISCDITNKQSVMSMAARVVAEFGRIDVLINNAAGKSKNFFAALEDFPEEDWKSVMDINVNSMFYCVQAVVPHMKRQSKGRIINICSTYGVVSPDQNIYKGSSINTPLIYATTKSAVLNFTRYLATYLAPHNITVNTLTPGGVFTNQDKPFVEAYCRRTPLGRMATQKDYQGAMIFLCSDSSGYMTGANLIVDGGWTCW